MNIAVIPARGGSKRIPRKNIKPFHGKPMIAYAIEAARASQLFEAVVVSTDDAEIRAVAESYGAICPFTRPPALSDDHTPTVPVIQHAINACQELGWAVDAVCCIYPCVPLITAQDLQQGYATLRANEDCFAFPVAAFPSAIQRALRREASGKTLPFYPEFALTRTQDLEPAFYDAGQFYWGRTPHWQAGLPIHQQGATFVMPEWRVVDIDTTEDWERAERLFATCQTMASSDATRT